MNFTIQPPYAKWSANGYRLPTEAEWEKAARGTLVGKDFPWGDTISPGDANYLNSSPWAGILNPPTTPVGFYDGGQAPAGPDRANGYGLYDMIGNLREWVWDWGYGDAEYEISPANDPRGWVAGDLKLHRGGDCLTGPVYKVYTRGDSSLGNPNIGFRCARGL